MQLNSQSGLSTLQLIIILAIAAVLLAGVSAVITPKDEQVVQQQAMETAAQNEATIETLLQNTNQDTATPDAEIKQKNVENKAEMADLMADAELDMDAAPAVDTTPAVAVDAPRTASAAGTFSDYDESKLTADGTNVLFFHADWCPSCRGLENDINANLSAIPAGVNILKLDYDSETELKKKYGIVRQHSLVVVDENGNEIKKLTGLTNTLSQVVNQL